MRRNQERFEKTRLQDRTLQPSGTICETWKVVDRKTGTTLRFSFTPAGAGFIKDDAGLAEDFKFWYDNYWRESKDERPKKKPRRYKKR
jgi:hypothetical protein